MEKEITWHIFVIHINCDINVLCPCFPTRHSHVWLNRCWQLIKETWICSGYLLMMRSIWLLWRKRRDSVRVQEATKTKAAGVKEISEKFVSLSFFLFCCGWNKDWVAIMKPYISLFDRVWQQMWAFESCFKRKLGNVTYFSHETES